MPSDDERPTGLARPDRAAQARVHDARERAIATLSDGFANDALDVDEFERRVTLAHTSESAEEIAALTSDLPAATTALAKATVALAPATADDGVAPETVYAIFGGVDRRGTWNVPRRWRVVAAFGGAQLDLREARFPTGVIDLEVKAVFGGVQIIVPPGLAVDVDVSSFAGNVEARHRVAATPDPARPLLRFEGGVRFGNFELTTRLPGETARDARKRERHERKARRKALRAGGDM